MQIDAGPAGGEATFRHPTLRDGDQMYRLVRESGVLDVNSCYMYLLLSRDFAATSIVADRGGRLLGFITGYRQPESPEVLFVWQVAVAATERGRGIAKAMLAHLLHRACGDGVRYLEATIAAENIASRKLFRRLAADCRAVLKSTAGFDTCLFADAGHSAEPGIRIGPVNVSLTSTQSESQGLPINQVRIEEAGE